MQPGWNQREVIGKPCAVYLPTQQHEHGFGLVFLHDVHPRDPVVPESYVQVAEEWGMTIVAPITGHSWWTDRIVPAFDTHLTVERFLLEHVLRWMETELGMSNPRFGLFGIGMGGQAALRFAYKHPSVFPVVAGVAPDLDYQYRILEGDEVLFEVYGDVESARQDFAILHIHPLNWPRHQFFCCNPGEAAIFDGVDRLRMKLHSIGVPFEIDVQTTTAAGHSYADTMAPDVVGYLADKLERERLRI